MSLIENVQSRLVMATTSPPTGAAMPIAPDRGAASRLAAR